MRLIKEETSLEYTYRLEIESIIFNRANLSQDLVEVAGQNFGNFLIRKFEENSKFIKNALRISEFEIYWVGIEIPTILLEFSCNKVIDEDSLTSTLGRYTTTEYKEIFETEDKEQEIIFKPVREELKIYLKAV